MNLINKNALILCSITLALNKDEDFSFILSENAKEIEDSNELVSRIADTLLQNYNGDLEGFTAKYAELDIEKYIGEGVLQEIFTVLSEIQNVDPRDKDAKSAYLERLVAAADKCSNNYIKYSVYGAVVNMVLDHDLFNRMIDIVSRLNKILLVLDDLDVANYFKYPYQKLKLVG